MKMPPEVQAKIDALVREVLDIAPDFQEVMDQAKEGEISEFQALLQLMEIAASDPKLHEHLTALSVKKFKIDPEEETAIARRDPNQRDILEKDFGLPQINPLFQAAILERLQFDGDIPEMRTGPLPPKARPAIPVSTTARSSVALGEQIDRAEEKLITKIDDNRKRIAESLQEEFKAIREKTDALVPHQQAEGIIAKYNNPENDIPEYRRGGLPAPIKVGQAKGASLLRLKDEERRGFTWKFLSTTHGRRSASPVIHDLILQGLKSDGFNVSSWEQDGSLLFSDEWSILIDGAQCTQANFAIVDVAAKSLTKKIRDRLSDAYKEKEITLRVVPSDALADRRVGWRVEVSQEVESDA
jgi:hypothetical protein